MAAAPKTRHVLGSLRRIAAGSILIVLGVALFAWQSPPTPERSAFGLVLLAAWGGSGVGVFWGRPWGRILGLAVSCLGLVVALWVASEGTDSPYARVFFPRDAARWYVVLPMSYAFAVLSGVAGALLLLPFRPGQPES